MQLPYFFEENLPANDELILSEESSKHIVQVLRMHASDQLLVTNGKGEVLTGVIVTPDKKKTAVKITNRMLLPTPIKKVSIAISLIKNKSRFEWFLEKAAEIGVSEIIPLICRRTEQQHFRYDRMKNILVSAMLQSQQGWLPVMKEPTPFEEIIKSPYEDKFIAHCIDGQKKELNDEVAGSNRTPGNSRLVLIGPEGDFTAEEVDAAIQQNFVAVSLGETRLRTETAGLVAAVLLMNK